MEGAKPMLNPLTPDELALVRALRDAEPELSIPFDDVTLSYFVFARKSDVTRAAELFRNHCKWRAEFDIANLDMVGIKRLLMSGLFGFLPADLRGPASEGVGFIYAAHAPDEMLTDAKLAMQMMWFVTDRLFRLNLDNARHGFTYVEDFTGITFGRIIHMARNNGNKDRFDALQDHMPGRFRKFILTNAPLWIRIPFKMMMPFMKPKLRSKFCVATNEEAAAYLGGTHMLPELVGGTRSNAHLHELIDMFPELGEVDLQINLNKGEPVTAK